MAKFLRPDIEMYHAHVYFQDSTRTSAAALYDELRTRFGEIIKLNSIADGPRGPHVSNMFGIDIPKVGLESVLAFLVLNHGQHSVLFHPVTGNELADHTHYAMWLGKEQALDLGCLIEKKKG